MKQIVKELSMFIEKDGQRFIKEGKALIQTKRVEIKEGKQIEEEVFYNPAQIINRDLTVLTIDTFSENRQPITILDALSASGLRSVRFAQEIQNIKEIYANDLSLASLALIEENIKLNEISNVKIYNMDANKLMKEDIKFDVIDLDPYGTVCPFLDSAIHACDDSLLCITCTDSRVLCGPDTQKCFAQYGTARTKMNCFAENGLRTLLYTISQAAGRLGKAIKPLISFYGEFYLRVFVHVIKDKKETHKLFSQIGNLFFCQSCQSFHVYPYGQKEEKSYKINKKPIPSKCEVCGSLFKINGPVWIDEINNIEFVKKMLTNLETKHTHFQTFDQIIGKLTGIINQHEVSSNPYTYNMTYLASNLKCSNISKKEIYAGFQSLGYKIAQCYLQVDLYKTNAPNQAIYDIIKTWKKIKYGDNYLKNIQENSPAYTILTSEIQYKPDFTFKPTFNSAKMFYPNLEGFGPKSKAIQRKIIELEGEQAIKKQKID
ncbi:unnamed protein product [Paramecium primaurelia]|uniref:tRNA (guanine(26)-N(2))-dimethyltransferase n=1 Tax=Paramecium primaurelia TaxID=5886 RepID=A0A8S1KQT3_PARPR|nr:unnamed protein product [Paramecium primaurelia]